MNFIEFRDAVAKNFSEMQNHQLYRTAAPKDGLWETYLGSFPEGSNLIYKERTEHDCQCCKQFIRSVGNVVTIVNGRVVSIWDQFFVTDDAYNVVAARMENYVKSFQIQNVFTHDEPVAGRSRSFQDLLEGKVKAWDHFYVNIQPKYVKKQPESYLGELRITHDLLLRGLETIKPEAIATVLELISQNALYRGEENRHAVTVFSALAEHYQTIATKSGADLFVWDSVGRISESVARIRNTSIGTLLTDLSEGMDLEHAVKSFEAKVAPTNYKRPTALVTKAMIDKAKTTVEELGLTSALERRYAKLTDITINNVLFADRSARKAMGDVFSELAGTVKDTVPSLDRIDDVPIEKFIADILPKADSIEILMRNNQIGNLVSLIAPADQTANELFKWGNRFSWSYNGDVADSIKERVKQAGGNVTGELCCRLAWDYTDDLDFHMIEPDGNRIYYGCRRRLSRCGGMLDVDANGADGILENPVENIFYSKINKMKVGQYKLHVNNYYRRSSGAGFEVEIDILGTVYSLKYEKALKQSENIPVAIISVDSAGNVTFESQLESAVSVKQVWGVSTNVFRKVNAIMLSPNHWDGQGVGNKHFFFMLDGCVNDGSARGFYNEFLKSELDQHRKVFEMVGAKMRTDESQHQLSGLGFSSTQRNSVVCRVKGSFSRIINITF